MQRHVEPAGEEKEHMTANSRVYHVSNRLWARLAPILDREDPAAAQPESGDPRVVLECILNAALDGDRRRDSAPPTEDAAVQTTYRRWRESGILDELSAVLAVRL
jgi:transposase